jgi:predicted ATPase
VALVPLAPILDPLLTPAAIGDALGLARSGADDPAAQLAAHLRSQQILIVLDSLEHLLGGAVLPQLINTLLHAAPGLSILSTSRERLRLSGEWVLELGGLDAPAQSEGGADAAALFLERAAPLWGSRAIAPHERAAIRTICRMLEGSPLAIELAATWVRTLSPPEIALEIGRSLDFLHDPNQSHPVEHQSMRAVFERSWALLPADQRDVLGQLSIFLGGCTREAAAAIAGASLAQLAALTEKSLLRRAGERFEMHDLIRRFCAEQLAAAPDPEAPQRRFVEYYLQPPVCDGARPAR